MRYYKIQFTARKGQTAPSSIAEYLLFESVKATVGSTDSKSIADTSVAKNNGGALEVEFQLEIWTNRSGHTKWIFKNLQSSN